MFAKLLLALLAVASPALALPPHGTTALRARDGYSCAAGTPLCCNSSTPAADLDEPTASLLGIPIEDILGNVATGCSPLVGGDVCGSYPVCCENNEFGGGLLPINTGCTDIITPL